MDRKELNKFFKEACETTQTKYHLLDMKIEWNLWSRDDDQ
jgi:hypothetical protein